MIFIIISAVEAAALIAVLGSYVFKRFSEERKEEMAKLRRDAFDEGYASGYKRGFSDETENAERLRETLRNVESVWALQ